MIGVFQISITGVVLNTHYCQGKLISIGVFTHAETCSSCTVDDCESVEITTICHVQKSRCCKDSHDYYKTSVISECAYDQLTYKSQYFVHENVGYSLIPATQDIHRSRTKDISSVFLETKSYVLYGCLLI